MATAKQTLSVSNILFISSHNIYLVSPTFFQKKIEKYVKIYNFYPTNIRYMTLNNWKITSIMMLQQKADLLLLVTNLKDL